MKDKSSSSYSMDEQLKIEQISSDYSSIEDVGEENSLDEILEVGAQPANNIPLYEQTDTMIPSESIKRRISQSDFPLFDDLKNFEHGIPTENPIFKEILRLEARHRQTELDLSDFFIRSTRRAYARDFCTKQGIAALLSGAFTFAIGTYLLIATINNNSHDFTTFTRGSSDSEDVLDKISDAVSSRAVYMVIAALGFVILKSPVFVLRDLFLDNRLNDIENQLEPQNQALASIRKLRENGREAANKIGELLPKYIKKTAYEQAVLDITAPENRFAIIKAIMLNEDQVINSIKIINEQMDFISKKMEKGEIPEEAKFSNVLKIKWQAAIEQINSVIQEIPKDTKISELTEKQADRLTTIFNNFFEIDGKAPEAAAQHYTTKREEYMAKNPRKQSLSEGSEEHTPTSLIKRAKSSESFVGLVESREKQRPL